jgi:low affinity Fe/Cu permease
MMDIESISGAATVALASTFAFVLIARSWQLIGRAVGSNPSFPDSIMREAAQRFRDEFERLSASQSIYLGAIAVFTVLFAAAHVLDAERLYAGYPHWQLTLLLAALTIAAVLAAYRLLQIVRHRRQVKLLRDANIAIGHQLQAIASGLDRVYHDVETEAGVVDHLVVGRCGAYAVNVVAAAAARNGTVALSGRDLVFRPTGKTHSVVDVGARVACLEREFRRLLDHRVRVRSVIAIPGWDVAGQAGEEHLLFNERSLPIIGAWRDSAADLADDDIHALQELLSRRCRRRRVRRQGSESRFPKPG